MSLEHNMGDYEKEYAEFKWEIPEKFNFARDVIDKWAEDPDKLAMKWVNDDDLEKDVTFADFSRASRKLANVLTGLGVGRGDVVMVMLGRDLEWWEVFTACIRMGALVSPGTTQLSGKDIEYRIKTAGVRCFITDNANAPTLEAVEKNITGLKGKIVIGQKRDGWRFYDEEMEKASDDFETADTASDEDSIVYFTSGTTGYPKMALHTHTYGLAHQTTGRYWIDLKPNDLHWNVSDTG
jgi:acyl-coenzyme A synthetase/AMP-(fatty) acid ligase